MKKTKVTCRFGKGDRVSIVKDGKVTHTGSVFTVDAKTGRYMIYAPGSTFATGLYPAADAELIAA